MQQQCSNNDNLSTPKLSRNKNFLLTFWGTLVSNIGSLLFSFAVSFYVLDFTQNNSLVQGTYLAMCGITFALFSLFGGVLCDKFNKAKIMYLCDYAKGSAIILSGLVLLFFQLNNVNSVVLLFVLGFVTNVIAGIFSPASGSLLPFIVQQDQLQQANSIFSVLSSFQSIVGVVLAGVLYAMIDITTMFFIVGICYVVSAVSEMFIKYTDNKNDAPLTFKSALADIADGAKYLFGNKPLFALLMSVLMFNFFFSPLSDNLLPYFVKTDLNGGYVLDDILTPEMWLAVLSVAFAVGSIVEGVILSTKQQDGKCGKRIKFWLSAMTCCVILSAVFYSIFVVGMDNVSAYLISQCVLMLIMGVTLMGFNIPVSTTAQTIVQKDMLGKTQGVMQLGSQGLIPLATFLAGVVLDVLGSQALLIICAIGVLTVDLCFVLNKNVSQF